MTTPIIKTPMTAAQWKKRYAEICKDFPDNPPLKALNRHELDRIRQFEQFTWSLPNPPAGRWRVVKVPEDTQAAFQALAGYVEGLSGDLPLTKL
jgi:hypothetical protein